MPTLKELFASSVDLDGEDGSILHGDVLLVNGSREPLSKGEDKDKDADKDA